MRKWLVTNLSELKKFHIIPEITPIMPTLIWETYRTKQIRKLRDNCIDTIKEKLNDFESAGSSNKIIENEETEGTNNPDDRSEKSKKVVSPSKESKEVNSLSKESKQNTIENQETEGTNNPSDDRSETSKKVVSPSKESKKVTIENQETEGTNNPSEPSEQNNNDDKESEQSKNTSDDRSEKSKKVGSPSKESVEVNSLSQESKEVTIENQDTEGTNNPCEPTERNNNDDKENQHESEQSKKVESLLEELEEVNSLSQESKEVTFKNQDTEESPFSAVICSVKWPSDSEQSSYADDQTQEDSEYYTTDYESDIDDYIRWNEHLKMVDEDPYKYDRIADSMTRSQAKYGIIDNGIFKRNSEFIIFLHMQYKCYTYELFTPIVYICNTLVLHM